MVNWTQPELPFFPECLDQVIRPEGIEPPEEEEDVLREDGP